MVSIENEYRDVKIRNVHFDNPNEDFMNISVGMIAASRPFSMLFTGSSFTDDNDLGYYVYIAKHDPTKIIRLYKDVNKLTYKYTYHKDYLFISKLQELQPKVQLSKFPTGIVTMENKIIGTEAPYYPGEKTLAIEIESGLELNETLFYVNNMVDILEELYEAGLMYLDVHCENFLVDKVMSKLDIIDFDESYLSFKEIDPYFEKRYEDMMFNLKDRVLRPISIHYGVDFNLDSINTLDDVKELVNSFFEERKMAV